jgi:galactokinase
VALVDGEGADDFARTVATAYQSATGLEPRVYVCSASAGASIESATPVPA